MRILAVVVFFGILILENGLSFAGDDNTCKELNGTMVVIPDPDCKIIESPLRHKVFQDEQFLAELGYPPLESCVTAEIRADLSGRPILGSGVLGQTTNEYPQLPMSAQLLSAADIIRIRSASGRFLGYMFLKHVALVDPLGPWFDEKIAVVGGTKWFRNVTGNLSINGNLFISAILKGKLCM